MHRDRWLDRLGVGLSFACGVHCLALPVLFALVPSLHLALHSFHAPLRPWAIALLRLQAMDRWLVALALAVAALSLWLGWRRHRSLAPLAWAAPAAAALAWAVLAPAKAGGGWHAHALLAGSGLLVAAHLSNLRRRACDRGIAPRASQQRARR